MAMNSFLGKTYTCKILLDMKLPHTVYKINTCGKWITCSNVQWCQSRLSTGTHCWKFKTYGAFTMTETETSNGWLRRLSMENSLRIIHHQSRSDPIAIHCNLNGTASISVSVSLNTPLGVLVGSKYMFKNCCHDTIFRSRFLISKRPFWMDSIISER